jgi:hypothetical protein
MMPCQQNTCRQRVTRAYGTLNFRVGKIRGTLKQTLAIANRGHNAFAKMQNNHATHSKPADALRKFLGLGGGKHRRQLYSEQLAGLPFIQKKNIQIRQARQNLSTQIRVWRANQVSSRQKSAFLRFLQHSGRTIQPIAIGRPIQERQKTQVTQTKNLCRYYQGSQMFFG